MSIAESIAAFMNRSSGWIGRANDLAAKPKVFRDPNGNKNGSYTKKGPGRYHLQGGTARG